jgi:hypothetical protein
MRNLEPMHALSAAAAIALLSGCSGGTAVAPKPALSQSTIPAGRITVNTRSGERMAGYNSCPATGTTEYVSDYFQNIIEVFHGNFHNQAPCGQITSGLSLPRGMYVDPATHDIYVANTGGDNVLVFHKGQTTPYNTYTDPTPQTFPVDVTLAGDGTVLASNLGAKIGEGSISTWVGGPNCGTFVGNFLMTNEFQSGFIAVQNGATVYFNDQDATSHHGALWSMSCPAGACGAQTRVSASFKEPGGMVFDSTGDLLLQDPYARRADIFELPNKIPAMFKTLVGTSPDALGIDERQHHWFTSDWNSEASEYSYPSGAYIGSVRGPHNGNLSGIAVDI